MIENDFPHMIARLFVEYLKDWRKKDFGFNMDMCAASELKDDLEKGDFEKWYRNKYRISGL